MHSADIDAGRQQVPQERDRPDHGGVPDPGAVLDHGGAFDGGERRDGGKPTDGTPLSPFTAPPILGLAALIFVAGLYVHHAALAALGLLPLMAASFAWGWARLGVWHLEAEASLRPSRVFAGEPITCRLHLHNRKPWPAFLDVDVKLQRLALGRASPAPIPAQVVAQGSAALPPLRTREWNARIVPQRRGVYTWTGTGMTSRDPWGWFFIRRPVPAQAQVYVYPALYPLPEGVTPRRDSVDGAPKFRGAWANRLFPSGVRDGGTGSLRDVDWRATARFQQLQFKEYDGATETGLWVFLDATASEARTDAFETALSFAASLLWQRSRAGDVVGFVTNARSVTGGPISLHHRVRGMDDFRKLLEWMAALEPGAGPTQQPWDAILADVGSPPSGTTPVGITLGQAPPVLQAFVRRYRGWLFWPEGCSERSEGPLPDDRTYALEAGRFVLQPFERAPESAPTRAEVDSIEVSAERGRSS